MPKRRRRRTLNWSFLLWLVLFANTAAGLWYSPVTSIRKLKIDGAQSWDRGRLYDVAQKEKNVPCLRLDPRGFESVVQSASFVRSADLRRSLFGTAGLQLAYRVPVANLEGSANAYLSDDGVIFKLPTPVDGLPSLKLHPSALKPSMTLAGSWPASSIAGLIRKIPPDVVRNGMEVEVDSEGAVCLNITQAARIVLGGADRLEEKLRTLEGLLAERPGLLQKVKELNLTEPTRPAYKAVPNKPQRGQKT